MTDKQLAVRESDIHAAYGRARLNWEREGGDLVALITSELNALLAAAPAAPTEGARDASAQQDGREAVAKWDCCANCMRPKSEHTMVGKCPDPFTTIWHEWDYDFAPDAKKSASAQQVQADAGAGTEVAWLQRARNGMIRCARTKRPDSDDIAVAEFDGDTITPLYAHPDPLLAECVEALENAVAFIEDAHILEGQWHWEPVEKASAILAKVQAAKEGKS